MKKTAFGTYEFGYQEEQRFRRILDRATGRTDLEKFEWIETHINEWADNQVLRQKIDELQAQVDTLNPPKKSAEREIPRSPYTRKPTLADSEVARLEPIMSYQDDT